MTLEKVYTIFTTPHDIVLKGKDWVYIFPDDSDLGFQYIHCLFLPTGSISPHDGGVFDHHIPANSLAKLHPSGNYIYSVDNYFSGQGMEKYDITQGVALYMYSTPSSTFPNHLANGDFWFSDD